MNLLQEIYDLMTGDDADPEDQSAQLLRLYDKSSALEKAAIDAALTCVCGYTLLSLKERAS